MPRPSKRERIVREACALVLEEGATNLTLDAVAARASVSKGGLLYHFPSRRHLVEAMVQHLLQLFDERLGGEEAFLTAYVNGATDRHGPERAYGPALLAAASEDPQHLDPLAAAMKQWLGRLMKGADPTMAMVVQLAADGLWYNELLGVSPLSGKRRQAVVRRLLELAAEAG